MPYIGKQPLTGAYQLCDTITTSATATYNLLVGGSAVIPGSANNCIVSLNGVVQAPVSAFTVSGSTITFASTLSATDVIDFILILGNVFDIGTPTNGSVNTSKLTTDLTVTHALGSAGSPSITFTGDTNTGIFSPTADTIAFTEGGTEAMRIDSDGDVGIGETNPEDKLHLYKASNDTTLRLEWDPTHAGKISFREGVFETGQIEMHSPTDAVQAGNMLIATTSSGAGGKAIVFQTDSVERMRIDSAGAVRVQPSTNPGMALFPGSNAQMEIGHDAACPSGQFYMPFKHNANLIGGITQNGTTAVAYNTTSDYRLKENVNYNFDATTRLKQLKPARFNFIIEPNRTVDGFLAHEVQDIISEAITGTKDETVTKEKVVVNANGQVIAENIKQADWEAGKIPNEEGKSQYPVDSTWEASKVVPVYQGIDQAKLTPLLTKALQEAIARIEQLEARLTALENNNV